MRGEGNALASGESNPDPLFASCVIWVCLDFPAVSGPLHMLFPLCAKLFSWFARQFLQVSASTSPPQRGLPYHPIHAGLAISWLISFHCMEHQFLFLFSGFVCVSPSGFVSPPFPIKKKSLFFWQLLAYKKLSRKYREFP